jgi:hypothetical protein
VEAAEALRRLLEDCLGGDDLKRILPTPMSYCHPVKYLPFYHV